MVLGELAGQLVAIGLCRHDALACELCEGFIFSKAEYSLGNFLLSGRILMDKNLDHVSFSSKKQRRVVRYHEVGHVFLLHKVVT